MKRAASLVGLILLGSAALVRAQPPAGPGPNTVSLRAEPCAALPFDPERVRALVAMELELDGRSLVAGEGANQLTYAPQICVPGATRFRIVAVVGGETRQGEAVLDDVALAAAPRALALHLVEMLRERHEAAPTEVPAEDPVEPTPEPAPTRAVPAPVPEPLPPVEAPDTDPVHTRSAFRLGGVLHVRNTPDSGAFVGGGRVALDLGFGDSLPLAMRVDAGFALGKARADVTLGTIDAGVGLFLRAVAADILDLRFGPRLSVGHAFHIGDGTRRSEDVQVAVGLRVGGGVRVAPGVDLLLEAEVGANLVDLELDVAGQRSGLIGAYWAADVGVAFDL